jgi:hypothetical protein
MRFTAMALAALLCMAASDDASARPRHRTAADTSKRAPAQTTPSDPAPSTNAVDELDRRLQTKLKGICRGC